MRSFVAGLLAVLSVAAPASAAELHVYAGAGLRDAVDAVAADFQEETGHAVRVEYGGSGQILERFRQTTTGDVFIAGAYAYIDTLRAEGAVEQEARLVAHTPVLGVNRETAGGRVTTFADLAKPGIKVGLGDPEAMALGRTAERILDASGLRRAVAPNVVVRAATVKQLSLYLVNGDIDAAIVGRADAVKNAATVALVDIDPTWYKPEIIGAAVLRTTAAPDAAALFFKRLTGPAGIAAFTAAGFLPAPPN